MSITLARPSVRAYGHQSARHLRGCRPRRHASQAERDATLEQVAQFGINHIDTAAGYGAGGPPAAVARHNRSDVFLATKTASVG